MRVNLLALRGTNFDRLFRGMFFNRICSLIRYCENHIKSSETDLKVPLKVKRGKIKIRVFRKVAVIGTTVK